MKTNRRDFLMSAALAGSASTLVSGRSTQGASAVKADYATLDRVLQQPVLKRTLFPSPVMIESVELLRDRDNFLCRVRSKDGAEGLSIGHPFIARHSYPIFVNQLAPAFVGKDARDLDQLIFRVSETNVKSQGVPFCVQLAMLEFAILDMLGNIADKPVGLLIGDMLNPEVSIYLGHHYSNVYMLQMVSVCPAAAKYHEFKMFQTADANGTMIPVESKAEIFESSNGVIKVPSGSGLGVRIDPDYIKTHTRFTG